ncbi:MAG TPA: hypothetical protein VGF45_19965 [Polyangia bacterium]
MRAHGRFLLAAMAASSPSVALACPSCATREGAGIGVFLLIGAMITVPYVVAAVTIRVMRRLEREP